MPICGFNDKMLEGLNAFNEGLVEHGLVFRGAEKNETLEQGIMREISDMARLKPELSRIDNVPKRVITTGIVTYATGFYLVMRQKGLAENPEAYKSFISTVNNYFRNMDEKYYGELEGNPNNMRHLVEYLNGFEL